MTTHSRILAWRIPLTEEPGSLQSIELPTFGYGWCNWVSTHTTAKTPVSRQKFSSLYLRRWHFTPNSGLYNNYSHSVDEEADSGKLSLHCLVCLHLQSFLYLHLCALQVFGHLSSLLRVLHFLWWLIPLFFFFYWRIVDSQYCVNFRCTAEYISVFADFIPL